MCIPVYCMEEHQEAYYYWNLFIEKGYIRPSDNYLLHVDHHDDMVSGGYDWDFTRPVQSLAEAEELAYEKLGIADFIVPAIYQGIFSEVHIVKHLTPRALTEEQQFVTCKGKRELIRGRMVPLLHASYRGKEDSPYRFYTLREGCFVPMKVTKDIVLDVDLDYFCWDDSLSSAGPKRMEITRQAYEEFVENPYHPFRILPRRLLHVEKENGRYYLGYQEYVTKSQPASKEKMKLRMERLLIWLLECGIKPKAIDLCRSRYSGYLHNQVYPWLEQQRLGMLPDVWEIEIVKK